MKLMQFDVLHCKRKSLLSRLISFFTKSKVTHTALVIEIWGDLYIIDAQRNGVNLKPLSEWINHYKYEYTVSRPRFKIPQQEFNDRAMNFIGFPNYDFKGLLLIQPIYILTGKWLGKHTYNDKRFYCSDYVGYCFEPYVKGLLSDYFKLSPKGLKERLDKSKLFD